MRKADMKGYSWYMSSPGWNQKKQAYRDSGRDVLCRVCASPEIHFHHRTYVRFMDEHLDDLVPLCEDHHSDLHVLQRSEMLSVEQATDKFLRLMKARRGSSPLSKEDRAFFQNQERARRGKALGRRLMNEKKRSDRLAESERRIASGFKALPLVHHSEPTITSDGLIRSSGEAKVGNSRSRRKRARR